MDYINGRLGPWLGSSLATQTSPSGKITKPLLEGLHDDAVNGSPEAKSEDTTIPPSSDGDETSTWSPQAPAPKESIQEQANQMDQSEIIYTLTNILTSSGSLGVPYVCYKAGISLTVLSLCLVVVVMTLTARFLIRSIRITQQRRMLDVEENDEHVDFGLLGECAFGRHGRKLITAIFVLEIWLVSVNFFVLIGINVNFCFSCINRSEAILGSALATFGLFYVPIRVLGMLSSFSMGVNVLLIVVLVSAGMSLPEPAFESEPLIWANPLEVVRALGVFLFCFAGHPYIPSIYGKARRQDKFEGSLGWAFGMAGVYQGACGVLGYVFYGSAIAQSFSVNLGSNLDGRPIHGDFILPLIAAGGLVIKLQAMMPILTTPLLMAIHRTSWQDKLAFVTITGAAAITLREYLSVVMSCTGLIANMTTSVVFPTLVYIRLHQPKAVAKYALFALCAVAYVFAFGGTIHIIWSTISGQ